MTYAPHHPTHCAGYLISAIPTEKGYMPKLTTPKHSYSTREYYPDYSLAIEKGKAIAKDKLAGVR